MSDNLRKSLFVTISVILITIIYMLTVIGIYLNIESIRYKDRIYPNTFLDNDNISSYDYKKLYDKIEKTNINKKIILVYNNEKIETSYNEIGIVLDKEETINSVKKHYENMKYNEKVLLLLKVKKDYINYKFKFDESLFRNYLNKIKEKYDSDIIPERFDRDENMNIRYIEGVGSHYLNIDKTVENIKKNGFGDIINLVVENNKATNHEEYKQIDSKVSTFSTKFNPYISRATNLRVALNYINGAIIEPGEVFSFYKYAGPYNKKGYVFYYEFVGNGVCQIATTAYNAALLAGLEIEKRYQHEYIAPYVEGGLDATVASYGDNSYIDMSFKNTYKYPIYISAYYIGDTAYVDIWSNSNAKEGKTYKTESVKIGPTSYTTYLHVYKDGEEIEKKKLSTSWYKVKEN